MIDKNAFMAVFCLLCGIYFKVSIIASPESWVVLLYQLGAIAALMSAWVYSWKFFAGGDRG